MSKKLEPPIMTDVIFEVQKLDILKKGTSEYDKAHEKTVKLINQVNALYGKGWTSLSKTRALLQYMRKNESGVFKPPKEKKEGKND